MFEALLIFIHLHAASIWVGGFVTIVVVIRVARRRLDPAGRVAFFRDLGRIWGAVSGSALLVALATGAVLISKHGCAGAPSRLPAKPMSRPG